MKMVRRVVNFSAERRQVSQSLAYLSSPESTDNVHTPMRTYTGAKKSVFLRLGPEKSQEPPNQSSFYRSGDDSEPGQRTVFNRVVDINSHEGPNVSKSVVSREAANSTRTSRTLVRNKRLVELATSECVVLENSHVEDLRVKLNRLRDQSQHSSPLVKFADPKKNVEHLSPLVKFADPKKQVEHRSPLVKFSDPKEEDNHRSPLVKFSEPKEEDNHRSPLVTFFEPKVGLQDNHRSPLVKFSEPKVGLQDNHRSPLVKFSEPKVQDNHRSPLVKFSEPKEDDQSRTPLASQHLSSVVMKLPDCNEQSGTVTVKAVQNHGTTFSSVQSADKPRERQQAKKAQAFAEFRVDPRQGTGSVDMQLFGHKRLHWKANSEKYHEEFRRSQKWHLLQRRRTAGQQTTPHVDTWQPRTDVIKMTNVSGNTLSRKRQAASYDMPVTSAKRPRMST